MRGLNNILFCLTVLVSNVPDTLRAEPQTLDQRLNALSNQIAAEMSSYQKKTIAVLEFVDLRGNVSDLGRFLSEEMVTRLYQAKLFKVIERQLLNKVISEQKLSLTGIVEPTSVKELGKILGVDAVISGTITELDETLRINARLISTETGEIFSVAAGDLPIDKSILKLIGGGRAVTNATPEKPEEQGVTLKTPAIMETEVAGLIVKIEKAKTSGEIVVVFTNIKSQDKTFDVGRGYYKGIWATHIIDDQGIIHKKYSVQWGKEVNSNWVAPVFLPGVSVRITFMFEQLPSSVTQLAYFGIGLLDENMHDNVAQFRNVHLSKN
jgi:TolB-like protein